MPFRGEGTEGTECMTQVRLFRKGFDFSPWMISKSPGLIEGAGVQKVEEAADVELEQPMVINRGGGGEGGGEGEGLPVPFR